MRSIARVLAALGAVLVSGVASAYEPMPGVSPRPEPSPQHVALELRVGPYTPSIDDEPGLETTPYKTAFGGAAQLYVGVELDWQALRIPHVGTLGPGFGAGWVSASQTTRTVSGRPAGDTFALAIYPLYLSAVLRGDALYRELGVPVVPFAKLGLGYGLWRMSRAGDTAVSRDVSAKGASLGPHLAFGVAIALDPLDDAAARTIDRTVGLNHTYLFAEYEWLTLEASAGPGSALYVGTRTWVAGLALEL